MKRLSRHLRGPARPTAGGKAARLRGAAGRAFTLAEVIVSIGILAIVGVVVGTIFATVGDTVTQGRQVSNLNRFVARVERVMRRDFENMVRENGFMVIRNERTHNYSGTPAPIEVRLTATDSTPRTRRIDELMFFARDEFVSRRTPLHPDMIARANAARVYYGHGQQMPEDFGTDPNMLDFETPYARPRLDESNATNPNARLGQPSALGVINPNEFASDWSLLRHVTLLVPRPSGLQDLPDEVAGLFPNQNPLDYNRVADSSRQIALGPAAQSVFRSVSQMVPFEEFPLAASGNLAAVDPVGRNIRPVNGYRAILNGLSDTRGTDETRVRPMVNSGVVDVAVTDLDEIRQTVTRTWFRPSPGAATVVELDPVGFTRYDYTTATDRFGFDSARAPYDSTGTERVGSALFTNALNPYAAPGGGPQPQIQQLWMLDAMPSVAFDPNDVQRTGHRVRFEDVPPRVYFEGIGGAATPEMQRQMAIEQADQEMIASSVFVPRCTEFIVEWSAGIVDRRAGSPTYGQQIWHGLQRQAPDGRVIVDDFDRLYGGVFLADQADPTVNDAFSIRGALPGNTFEDNNLPINGGLGAVDEEIFELVRMRRRFPPDASPNDDVIAEYLFGYGYRDWNLDADMPPDGQAAGDADDVDRDWPWPTMVRVTMRFVDPADLEDEQTFQFEFRVPGLRGRL